ncbi:hypothetical protein ACFPM3_00135 [Streptomyces coeruleoprunus]|uniref:Uncharacterized protein n=1 Tax=Streptomyces coeruleoprunus TaxID=285563 RepID=A0ABV9X9K7_9ACTN
MTFLDRQLIGLWDSAPYDLGAMETSEIVFLADGRGWSRFESITTELVIGRFRWHCPAPGRLELRYTWQVHGQWGRGSDGFASVDHSGPDDEVVRTGYRIAPETPRGDDAPVPTLTLDRAVEYAFTFARGPVRVSPSDDPSSDVVPYAPGPKPGPPHRPGAQS